MWVGQVLYTAGKRVEGDSKARLLGVDGRVNRVIVGP